MSVDLYTVTLTADQIAQLQEAAPALAGMIEEHTAAPDYPMIALAFVFSQRLRARAGDDASVLREADANEDGSFSFCEPDSLMFEAFAAIFGREMDMGSPTDPADGPLFDAALQLAADRRYFIA